MCLEKAQLIDSKEFNTCGMLAPFIKSECLKFLTHIFTEKISGYGKYSIESVAKMNTKNETCQH